MKVLVTGAHFTPAQAVIEEILKSQVAPQGHLLQRSGTRVESQGNEADSRLRGSDGSVNISHPDRPKGAEGSVTQYSDQSGVVRDSSTPPVPDGIGSARNDLIDIVYVGRKTTREGDDSPSVESRVLPKLGVKFIPIIAGRVRRDFSFETIISLLKIPVGFWQGFLIMLREKPDVVVSFGGYIGVPIVFSAWLLNIPVIVHEQTLVSGLANTFSQFFASKVAVSFDKKYGFDQGKILVSGNPMRKKILNPVDKGSKEVEEIIERSKKARKPLILITGGNQGSHSINLVVEEVLEELLDKYCIIHQTGDSKFQDYERLEKKRCYTYDKWKVEDRYLVAKWISEEDLGRVFSEIDLAVSRCGVNTLLELAYHQVPTLMIPLPFVTKDEQTKNARFFSEHGLGKVLLQKELKGERLLKEIEGMIGDKKIREEAKRAREVVILGAEKRLALEILEIPYKV